ncbi:MAG: hypothetical protein KF758_07995 [Anaerolineales bacterium]|nr:hypothetical protein [Anaerolineales bacterium]MBX3036841.1 hypothetical protein [Anaerolineales bacterium]
MKNNFIKVLIIIGGGYVFFRAMLAFEKISSGTGFWWQTYSMKWGLGLFGFAIFCALSLALIAFLLWRIEIFGDIFQKLISFRKKIGAARFALAVATFIFPIWFFQFTAWGVVFNDLYIRLIVWAGVIVALSFLISNTNFIEWKYCLIALLLTSALFVSAVSFINVTDYPFSMGWSEGNRMWDYSIMFGRELYDYPSDKNIEVLLDVGRQFVGGLPFIFSGVTIYMERFWIALTLVLPYLLLGLAAFRFTRTNLKEWAFTTFWAFIFLKQGPIHPPLVLCAAATALVWRSPLWLGIPLIAVTSYFAEASRFTWVFAPGMWIGMLEIMSSNLQNNKLPKTAWVRAITLALTGFIGGQYGKTIISLITVQSQTPLSPSISVNQAVSMVAAPSQPLLWYRLLPTDTYPLGILFGLLIATLPLIFLLIYLIVTNKWQLNLWQKLAILGPLTAFLIVGIIVSTKIGGGGDLHNLDMFLIGLMFTGVVSWEKAGKQWFTQIHAASDWIKTNLVLFFVLPGVFALGGMRSFAFAEDAAWLAVLTDSPNEKALDMIPSDAVVSNALDVIQEEVNIAVAQGGEVLFIDQRQLLTFGYITNVPFIPEYEKKILMNNALGSRQAYFQRFYGELATKRFALIISEPLRFTIQDTVDRFGEENNAWVQWVSIPVLCYYDIKTTLREVNVQLLVPKLQPVDCSAELPVELP